MTDIDRQVHGTVEGELLPDSLADLIHDFIVGKRAEIRIYPDLYASDLADAIRLAETSKESTP